MSLAECILFSKSMSTPWEPCTKKHTSLSDLSNLSISTITQRNFEEKEITISEVVNKPAEYVVLDIAKKRKELGPKLNEMIEDVDHNLEKILLKAGVPQFISAEKPEELIDVFSFGPEKLFIYIKKADFEKIFQ